MNEIEKQIQSVLFWKAEPIKVAELAKLIERSSEEVEEGITGLQEKIKETGLSIIHDGEKVALTTSPENAELINRLQKEELTKDLTKATLETLSIILYRGPIKRSAVDYIRGVNSQFTIRTLLIRGLIEKISDPDNDRIFLYKPSFDLLAMMGLQNVQEVPEYSKVNEEIDRFMAGSEEENQDKNEKPD